MPHLTVEEQLNKLGFPPRIGQHRNLLAIEKVDAFARKYVTKLIVEHGQSKVQTSIANDDNPNDPVINYITCIMELGMLHELYFQSFATANSTLLNERMEYLAQALNIAVATNLKNCGIKGISQLSNGINIYYTWDNMETLIKRIWPIAVQMEGAEPLEVKAYIDQIIASNL